MDRISDISILQICAHLGAGAGKAIAGMVLADNSCDQSIVILEKPEKTNHLQRCVDNGTSVYICPSDNELLRLIHNSDIIVLNWWNHPSTDRLLNKLRDISCRAVLWSHVNGCNPPILPARLADSFDACMFTSRWSLENPHWKDEERNAIKGKSGVVYGTGDFNPEDYPAKKDYTPHNPLRIGYTGTLDYIKLNPEFLHYCRAVLDSGINAEFILAGDPDSQPVNDVKRAGLSDYIQFPGFIENIPELLESFDIFGYLLNPENYATTENSLLEAMAAGLPCLACDGFVEREIITDNKDGFLVKDSSQYASVVKCLCEDATLREEIGKSARKSICKRYSPDENAMKFMKIINSALMTEKHTHNFTA